MPYTSQQKCLLLSGQYDNSTTMEQRTYKTEFFQELERDYHLCFHLNDIKKISPYIKAELQLISKLPKQTSVNLLPSGD
jgi:hypothetical protein